MNKQVLIEKLKEEKEKNHVRCVVANPAAIEVNNTFYQVDKALETAINYAEKLDESQKTKVPACVAAWIKWNKGRAGSVFILFDIDKASAFEKHQNGKGLLDWMIDHRNHDLLIRAWLDGYEVEEEPKWVVKVGNLYFCGWEDTTAQFVMNTVLGEDESIIKYKNEGTASSVAKNLGGTVKKV